MTRGALTTIGWVLLGVIITVAAALLFFAQVGGAK